MPCHQSSTGPPETLHAFLNWRCPFPSSVSNTHRHIRCLRNTQIYQSFTTATILCFFLRRSLPSLSYIRGPLCQDWQITTMDVAVLRPQQAVPAPEPVAAKKAAAALWSLTKPGCASTGGGRRKMLYDITNLSRRALTEEPEESACAEGGVVQLVKVGSLIQRDHLLFLTILARVSVANAALWFPPNFHASVTGQHGSLEAPRGEEVSLCRWFLMSIGGFLACAFWF
jgi:hypothetical protein